MNKSPEIPRGALDGAHLQLDRKDTEILNETQRQAGVICCAMYQGVCPYSGCSGDLASDTGTQVAFLLSMLHLTDEWTAWPSK